MAKNKKNKNQNMNTENQKNNERSDQKQYMNDKEYTEMNNKQNN
jgi:hypothetical protein